ncbi:Predicted membrane protein [Enterobacter cloacae]|uniref:Predicted membrane protein n=1 Tax=Enterobacter cloacae TaxID=550 RepID=A0A377LRF2_ENTCL|nr:Predicted membrane protein [Enterobacter cloacae]
MTKVWCGFFIGNGAVALFTVLYADLRLWTLWNGMLSYILMGTLMAGEWLVRQRVIKNDG